ncbi:hypothetical protein CKN82_00720 [Carnobacterium divergens]|uniref:YfhO family protein n=1 Tax=Carnobacterium divergens TaxID=2748 RepID=UPI001071A838|nr:YfhO family protein [Carnobacterium divergens]TFI72822.1 hypothetical protein CKN70_00720 [Carnobacterium divergens]TFI85404.1 hypothetical protein CKN68_00720 [Carnobacterium divergens]TFI93141.1 hypothetical protein CKN72_00720 [Carnobacterium divergens]TFJ00710.1 hypothetical protein CKN67_00720 [Carnobacterium divergens]TFJ01446.1 hypothetical protein CKN82_00720 [Carnobacterium divergens]
MKKINYMEVFFAPIIIIMLVFFLLKMSPFETGSFWYIDLPSQLMMFYNHFYDSFYGSESLLYSWNYGMGMNFWATFCYYLSSPLSFIILMFPRTWIPQMVVVIWLVKLGLASLTMSLMLKRIIKTKALVNSIFSVSYSLIAFSLTYSFLPMWIDGVYLLPLLIYSIYSILYDDKYKLFLATLTILFISNFYIAYIVGIFIFLYFSMELYILAFSKKEVIKKYKQFFVSVFLATCFAAFIILPTYLQVKSNNYENNEYNLMGFSMSPFELYSKFFNGTTVIQNLSIYAGLIVLLLVPIYFFNKKYSLKERLANLSLLIFLLVSILFNLLNYIWHIFEIPNGAFYRFGFVISFYLILLSAKSFIALNEKVLPKLTIVYFITSSILFFLYKTDSLVFYKTKFILNAILLTGMFALLVWLILKPKYQKLLISVLFIFVIGDLFLNAYYTLRNYREVSFDTSWYDKNNPDYDTMFKWLNKNKSGFYRTKPDMELVSSENESLRYNYKGMSSYTSTGNGELNQYLASIGYAANTRTIAMKNGIFISDSLFSFKYDVTKKNRDARIYKKVNQIGDLNLYENKLSLPLGYMVKKEQFEANEQETWIEKQNNLLGRNSENQPYYKQENLKPNFENLNYDKTNQKYQIIDMNKPAFLTYQLKIKDVAEFLVEMNSDDYVTAEHFYKMTINGKKIDFNKLELMNLANLGVFENQEITLKIDLINEAQSIYKPQFYTLNYSLVNKQVNKIKKQSLYNVSYNNKMLKGTIDVTSSDEVLFLSIPYDKNWQIKVNNVKVDGDKMGGFIGVPLKKGKHLIELNYRPMVIYVSSLFSFMMLVIYLMLLVFMNRKTNN